MCVGHSGDRVEIPAPVFYRRFGFESVRRKAAPSFKSISGSISAGTSLAVFVLTDGVLAAHRSATAISFAAGAKSMGLHPALFFCGPTG